MKRFIVATVHASGGSGMIHLARSCLSNVMWPYSEVSCLPECTECPGYTVRGFFSSLMARMIMPGFIRLKL